MKHIKVYVGPSESGMSLVQFIAHILQISKKQAKKRIDERCIFINGKRVWMAHHKINTSNEIEIIDSSRNVPYGHQVPILFEDDAFLIANKPPGIVSRGQNSLENALRKSMDMPALSAVHRLDKDTSGCIIFAKCTDAANALIALFARRLIKKTYHAIVRGELTKRKLTLRRAIDGYRAITHIDVLKTNELASYLQVRIETGRTHQIRKHLTGIGHPVIGDQTYGTSRRISPIERAISRQMLHAFRLIFTHPLSGDSIRCTAPLPDDFRDCLKRYNLK